MKKIIYILLAACVAVASCQTAGISDSRTTSVPPAPGTMVEVTFTADIPGLMPGTKAAMAEVPVLEKMYVAVFGEGMFLQNWIPATLVSAPTGAGSDHKATYKVMLPIVEEERTLDFVVNPPAGMNPPTFDYEWNILPGMVTAGTDAAYWQRINLPDGIKAKKNATGDYEIDPDTGNYVVDETSVADLKLVYLIRNYAKIVVESGSPMFDVNRWTLINYPDRGSLAPLDVSTGKISEAYMQIKDYDRKLHPEVEVGAFYDELTTTYIGYSPDDMEIVRTFVDPSAEDSGYVGSGEGKFMYERQVPEQFQTCILAEIVWKTQEDYEEALPEGEEPGEVPADLAGKTYWYKIEVLDNEGEYIPLLRNIQYNIKLDGLNEAGYSTARLAFDGDFFGNISSSLETSTLNEISDGVSRIYVDYMDQTFLGEDTGETLTYWFSPDDSDTHITKTAGDVTISVTQKNVAGYTNPIKNLAVNYDTGVITFDTAERTNTLQKGIIRVQGKVGSSRALFREVTINVIGDLAFSSDTRITKTPTTDVTDQEVGITIGLDDDLPASLFPIQVRIEAEQNSLSSTDPALPVSNGPSKFASKSGLNSFFFIYTIERSDYYHVNPTTREVSYTNEFPIKLYTTKNGGNSTDILISDMKGRFEESTLTLTIGN